MRKRHKNKKIFLKKIARTKQRLWKAFHWIIPNKRNHFHPKALQPVGLIAIALIVALIPTAYNLATTGRMQVLGYATNINIDDLVTLGNQERSNAGQPALTLNSALSRAAFAKAQDMFANNYWAHTSPSGATPWMFITNSGYGYSTAGENLAKNFSSSAGVMYGWMNSPTHRANVLGAQYKDVGYAVVNGSLLGEDTTLVVAMYGAPQNSAPTPAAPAAATSEPPAAPTVAVTPPPTETTPQEAPVTTAPTEEVTQAAPVAAHDSKNVQENTIAEEKKAEAAIPAIANLAPVKAYAGLNWGQRASLFVLSALLLLYVMKHTAIWRNHKRGLRDIWLRAHPMAQGGVLMIAIVITLASGTGSIL